MLSESTRTLIARAARTTAVPIALGRVVRIAGLLVEATIPGISIGDMVEIEGPSKGVRGEVVGFRETLAQVMPYGHLRGTGPGARVRVARRCGMPVGESLIGRIVDPFGAPLDGKGPVQCTAVADPHAPPPEVYRRDTVGTRFDTGVRTIDGMLTCGRGQRIGIFAGAGVGKSMLVEQIADQSSADVTVIGLIGERGREVRDLLARMQGRKLVAVAATSDRSPMERVRGAQAATAVAEYFRDRGAHVLLIVDSITRYAMAWREVGLAAGEPPATKGYPPSVFAELPRLMERVSPIAGGGSITAFYTVLVEGDDLADPVADSARSLLDAHIVLSRELAAAGHFPAIDVLASASRVAHAVTDTATQRLQQRARSVLAARREAKELRSMGAYTLGADPRLDAAFEIGERVDAWMQQHTAERSDWNTTTAGLAESLGPDQRGNRS